MVLERESERINPVEVPQVVWTPGVGSVRPASAHKALIRFVTEEDALIWRERILETKPDKYFIAGEPTTQTIEYSIQRACELGIPYLIVCFGNGLIAEKIFCCKVSP